MKNRIHKILGIGLALVLALALVAGFALPVAASPGENEWQLFDYPAEGEAGDWFRQGPSTEAIGGIGPMAQAINGDLYAYVKLGTLTHNLFKSDDGGRTWADTGYDGGAIVDMVCSSIDEDILYVTDGEYVYKSTDAGDEFAKVAKDSLSPQITGELITCIDVTYDDDDHPFIFIGTKGTVGSVYFFKEVAYPKAWEDLELLSYGTGYDAYSIGCAPDWATSSETYVVVSKASVTPAENRTFVISTTGAIGTWDEMAELLQNCVPGHHFEITAASRIGFPDDWEDTETLFVGVVDAFDDIDPMPEWTDITRVGGDVYRVTSAGAIDLNVEGIDYGCVGLKVRTNIISLDIYGDTDDAALIAGANDDTNVYYSIDGWSWDASTKDPTGDGPTYVLWYEDSALAATSSTDCAVSLSCGDEVGEYWNQISLIATDIEAVQYLDHSPGYITESETMFMVTGYEYATPTPYKYSVSLFRYDGTYWERVFWTESGVGGWMVLVSPDFNDTNCVYVANMAFEIWRTLDAGCSWKKLTFPCEGPLISSGVVIDEDTGITGGGWGDGGKIYKTTRHGARPWDEYEVTTAGNILSFDLEPGYDDPGTILLGDSKAQVFISEDGGETWDLVGEALPTIAGTIDTSVVFDPGYATNDTIYAAAGDVIARCVIDPDEDWADQEWDEISGMGEEDGVSPVDAWGIAVAGDTALYVGDRAEVVDPATTGGVLRSLNPDADDVEFERIANGLTVGTEFSGLLLTTGSNVLWGIDWGTEDVLVYEDTLATPVLLSMPVEGQKLTTTTKATLSWLELDDATLYEVSLYRYCPECPDLKEKVPIKVPIIDALELEDTTEETCITVKDLDPGTLYYWKVRVALGEPTLSKWSEERTFTTALVGIPDLCSPVCGGQDIILTPNFSWDKVSGATGYNIELAITQTFTAGVVRGKSTVNAWVAPAPLEYATTYYWRVRAEKDGVYSDWSVCIFTTMEKPVAPPPPVVVEPTPPAPVVPAPIIEFPPTPSWVWAIIGIGTALVVVVIVLTVRTRRPPA